MNINRQTYRAHQARWSGVAAGVASLAVILVLAVAGPTISVSAAAASNAPGMSALDDGPAGGISVPID